MKTYLDPKTDPPELVFKDGEVKTAERDKYHPDWTRLCPRCHGYGGWNLLLDEYGEGKHFKCWCDHCWGWGFTPPEDTCDGHEYTEKTIGNCLHLWTCKKCGLERTVDSSG